MFKQLIVKIILSLILAFCSTEVFAQDVEKSVQDNFLWTHRKERHVQFWVGGGPIIGTRSGFVWDPNTYKPDNYHGAIVGYSAKSNKIESLASRGGPYGLGLSINMELRANRWFGLNVGLGYDMAYFFYKYYQYPTSMFVQLDTALASHGIYHYTYDWSVPSKKISENRFYTAPSINLQLMFQVPGGRMGIRTGLKLIWYSRFLRQLNPSASFVSALWFNVTPRLRAEVQRSYIGNMDYYPYYSYNLTPARGVLLFSLQYNLNPLK